VFKNLVSRKQKEIRIAEALIKETCDALIGSKFPS